MPTVYIIDDDESVRRALSRLVRSAGMESVACASVDEFLALDIRVGPSCVVVDVGIPGTDSLDLPELLAGRELTMPVIFLTAQDAPEARIKAKAHGGAALLHKPVDGQALLDVIARLATSAPEPDVYQVRR